MENLDDKPKKTARERELEVDLALTKRAIRDMQRDFEAAKLILEDLACLDMNYHSYDAQGREIAIFKPHDIFSLQKRARPYLPNTEDFTK